MKKLFIGSMLVFGGLLTAQAQCKTITSLNENFDNWKEIDKCWKADGGEAMLYHKDGRVVFYSMMNPEENMVLFTPKVKAGKYSLSLDALNKSGKAVLVIGNNPDVSNNSAFNTLTESVEITEGTKEFSITLTEDSHIAIKVLLTGVHQAVYLDNLVLKATR